MLKENKIQQCRQKNRVSGSLQNKTYSTCVCVYARVRPSVCSCFASRTNKPLFVYYVLTLS